MNYQMYDRPARIGENNAVSIDRILSSGNYPDDILDNPSKYLSDYHKDPVEAELVVKVLREVQGNPDAELTIFRGTPIPELNDGDWVSLSREFVRLRYARPYSENPRAKLYAFTVKASQVSFTGKSLFEYGYFGETVSPI